MAKEKTLTEIYPDDLQQLHFIKISTKAKNLPDVLHEAIIQLKRRLENGSN